MRKLFTLFIVTSLLFTSCSKDEEVVDMQEPTATDFLDRVNQGEFDNSKMGLYKGIFTTDDATTRATVQIEIDSKGIPVAILRTQDGQNFELNASESVTRGKQSDRLLFSSSEISFEFSVDENGKNPVVANVKFKGLDSDIRMSKQTSRQPVQTVTGTYTCVDCSTHPDLGEQPETQTFNFMFSGTGENATVETQVTLKNKTYGPGALTQSNCTEEGNFTTCNLNGTLQDEDETEENLAFFGDSGPVYLTGVHTYNNQTSGAWDCSSISGTMRYESYRFGTSILSFQSDEAVNCEIPAPRALIFEDFEDYDVEYVMTRRVGDEVIEDDLALLQQNRYYGILIDQDAPNVNYEGRLGNGYFGAQNINSAQNPVNRVRLTWSNIDVSDYTLLDFSLFFATFEENPEGDWDQTARAGVEYSFDGGETWNKILAVEAGPGNPEDDQENDLVYEDVNFDGIGDVAGARIDNTFVELSRQLETAGNSTIDIRIYVRVLNNDQEDIALDNFLVTAQ